VEGKISERIEQRPPGVSLPSWGSGSGGAPDLFRSILMLPVLQWKRKEKDGDSGTGETY
jgi:hypothetical protein